MAKEYIEREALKTWLHEEDFGTPDERWRPESEFGAMIDALPAVDVVEVVRCRDCKNLVIINKEPIYAYCYQTRKVFELFGSTADDTREFFCWYGERKERG